MNKILIITLISVFLLGALIGFVTYGIAQKGGRSAGAGPVASSIKYPGTNSSVNVSSTLALVLSDNGGAGFRSICHEGTVNVYLGFNETVTSTVGNANYLSTSTGYTLFPSTCLKIGIDTPNYHGSVWSIAATSTAQKLTTLEASAQ